MNTHHYFLVIEALAELCKKIGLRDPRGWALFITYNSICTYQIFYHFQQHMINKHSLIARGLGEKERISGTLPVISS